MFKLFLAMISLLSATLMSAPQLITLPAGHDYDTFYKTSDAAITRFAGVTSVSKFLQQTEDSIISNFPPGSTVTFQKYGNGAIKQVKVQYKEITGNPSVTFDFSATNPQQLSKL